MKAVLCCLIGFLVAGATFADPDSDFAQCCKDKSVSDSCQKFCGYGHTLDDYAIAFDNKQCSLETDLQPWHSCFENQKDNTQCCKDAGVGADPELSYCLDLCNGVTPFVMDPKYFNCKNYWDATMKCAEDSHQKL